MKKAAWTLILIGAVIAMYGVFAPCLGQWWLDFGPITTMLIGMNLMTVGILVLVACEVHQKEN